MASKHLLVFDFDGTIVEEDSVARVLKILPREIRKHGFSHYVDLFQHASKKVSKMHTLSSYGSIVDENRGMPYGLRSAISCH